MPRSDPCDRSAAADVVLREEPDEEDDEEEEGNGREDNDDDDNNDDGYHLNFVSCGSFLMMTPLPRPASAFHRRTNVFGIALILFS